MASPQLENGYFRIANEIGEALAKTNLSAYQSRILWAILRKTYGYRKKEDYIPYSQISTLTGMHKAHISRTLKELRERNIVTKRGNKMGFNKDYQQWRELPKGVTSHHELPRGVSPVTKRGNKKLPKGADSINNKDTYQKKPFFQDAIAFELASFLLEQIRRNKPDFKEPNLQAWAKDFELMIRRDKRDPERIRKVIAWAQSDLFWHSNILSPKKLREKFDQLEMKMKGKDPTEIIPDDERLRTEEFFRKMDEAQLNAASAITREVHSDFITGEEK
jgi:phage replication O-like protein O